MSAPVRTVDDPGASPAPPVPTDRSGALLERVTASALVGFAIAVVVAFWLPVLTVGLMTDEMLSAWVSSDGLLDTVERAHTHQGNSPLYFVLLWIWRAGAGSAEWLLRLPSMVCALAAAWQLARLGRDLDGGRRLTGLIAAFVLIVDVEVLLAATTARPYGLLLLLVVVSARSLLRFLADGDWRAGITWVLTAVASLAMTPFAALALVAHVVALTDRAAGRTIPLAARGPASADPGDGERWRRRLPALCAAGAVAALPLAPQVLALSRRSEEIVIAAMPDLADLLAALVPVAFIAAVAIGALAGGWRTRADSAANGAMLRFVGTWALAPTVLAWLMSHATGASVWVERYRLSGTPALALLVGLGVSRIDRSHGRALAAAAVVAASLWSVSEFAGLQRQGWREAIEWADAETAGETVTVAIDSDLVELENLALVRDPSWEAYLSAPIGHYGLEGDVVILPKGSGDDIAAHQRQVIDRLAASDDTVVVITRVHFRGPPDQLGAIRDRFGSTWTETAGPVVGPHQAVVFRR